MKICYLNFDGAPTIKAAISNRIGGLNVILFNLLKYASLLSHLDLLVLYRDDGLDIPSELANMPITIERIIAGKSQPLTKKDLDTCLNKFISSVGIYLQNNKPELIHTSGSESGYVMMKLRQFGLRIPWVHTNYATLTVRRVVVYGQSILEALTDSMGQRESSCLENCDHIIALSEVDRQETSSIFGIMPSKITVAEPGIDHEIFYPGNFLNRLPVIISAGRMSAIKDFPFLIRCFRQVVNLVPHLEETKLIIVGGNEEERYEIGLPQIIKHFDLESKIEFIDGVDQIRLAEQFRRARIFAGVSKHETFGLLPVEARACGTPSVVRANSGYLTTAIDGFGGYFTNNDSEQDMANKISYILNLSNANWIKKSHQAVETAKKFQWPNMVKTCLDVYQRLLGSSKISLL